MSASEIIPTEVKKATEYKQEGAYIDQNPLYTQLLEQIKNLTATVNSQANTITELTHELEWFRRNMFGKKTETSKRFNDYDDPSIHQMSLFDLMTDQEKLMLGIVEEKPEEKDHDRQL